MANNQLKNNKKIGVLALQGDFREHIEILNKLGAKCIEIKTPEHLDMVDALIIPGGESTTITKLLLRFNLFNEVKKRAREGMPIYGTCAGAIVLAKVIINSPQPKLGLIDISIERNSYGRQTESFEAKVDVKGVGKIKGVFIRAPAIKTIGENVEILAKHNGNVVVAKQNNILISTFHPEITGNTKIHEVFVSKIINYKNN